MSGITEMRPARLKMESRKLALPEALAWAADYLKHGWLLAESPEKTTWQAFDGALTREALDHCQSLILFNAGAELRVSLPYAGGQGHCRLIWRDDAGEEGVERVSSYRLRGQDKGRLEFAEFFAPSADYGILQQRFARYCGVRGL